MIPRRFVNMCILVGLLVPLLSVASFTISNPPVASVVGRRLPFSPPAVRIRSLGHGATVNNPDDILDKKSFPVWKQTPHDILPKAFAVSLLSIFMWSSPVAITTPSQNGQIIGTVALSNNVVSAKEMASGSGSRVNKDPESLLRYGLPIDNQEVGARTQSMYIEHVRLCFAFINVV
jgi:hypothetical protein